MKALTLLEELRDINDEPLCTAINEAIEELEELQNSNCENCMWYKYYPITKTYFCNNESILIGLKQCDVEKDFCCNKWESK